jgi:hypothetical protein
VLIINRGSGSSNTTKTISTDTSSRHSNVSTAASSADLGSHHEEQKLAHRKPTGDGLGNAGSKSPGGFLKSAGRSFSFGGQKKPLPVVPNLDEPLPPPPVPPHSEEVGGIGRARATTASTSATVTPPKLESDFSLDLGGDFGKMFGFDKRASVMTIRGKEANGRQSLGPRSLTGNRLNQPAAPIPPPIQIDNTSRVDAAPHSWSSQHSNEGLLTRSPVKGSPVNENAPPAVPRQPSPLSSGRHLGPAISKESKKLSGFFGKRASPTPETEDEDAKLLKDSLSTVSKFMAASSAANPVSKPKPGSRYRRDEDTLATSEAKTHNVQLDDDIGDDNLFDNSLAHSSRVANRFVARKPSPPRTKVMTPAQFERYRQDKERQGAAPDAEKPEDKSDDEEIDYDDDEDDIERTKQQAKQRRKQEAHMAVYRQQMMKVTGESNGGVSPSRPSLQMSFSTPNLPNILDSNPAGKSSDSDEDEEVPLAILAAHGFPNKARPPTRLSTMMSNPNLRASAQPSYQRAGSVAGDAHAGGGGRLPAFARRLPQDPFVGAGLVHNPVRESIAFSGGAPARGHPGPVPPGGLVGVIVNEERSRAMRRGSPHVDPHQQSTAYDAVGGIPPHMLYQNRPVSTMMTPGDQAQMQMTQQMQQFMQMQMQFMQMMSGQNGNPGAGPNGMPNGINPAAMNNMMAMGGMGGPDMRHAYMGNGSVVDLPPRPESHSRSMSMVQPSSASWIQPPPQINPGFAPSIHIQGVGYAPSIAPSERSNIGLPGRYRPVSHMPAAAGTEIPRSSTMSGALGGWDKQLSPTVSVTPVSGNRKSGSGNPSDDEDEEEGWQAMKAKREKKRSIWKSKKSFGADIAAMIN